MPTNDEIWAELLLLRQRAHRHGNLVAVILARMGLIATEKGNVQPLGAPMTDATGDSVEIDLQNKKFAITGQHVGLIFSFITAVGVGVLCWVMWNHQQDARDGSRAFVDAIKEQTGVMRDNGQATREQNCLSQFEIKERVARGDFCKQVSR